MKYSLLLAGFALLFVSSGCMTGYTTVHHRHAPEAEQDSLMPPPLSINDVIALSQDSVSDEVIISQMEATNSYFRLTTDDILALRKAGVSDKVINAMIKTSQNPPKKKVARQYIYYPYWGYSWYPYGGYWWSPWYYPYSFGYSGHVSHGWSGVHYGGYRGGGSRGIRTGR